ncbi:MAG: SDR family oxidoreductase [Lachnospiraceae bacterium]|nr:SDR family oxidoreductase [Lachnospiraceae bacterium]
MGKSRFDLTGKVAMVSGANDGIGQGIAVGLAEAGADIVALHRSDITATKEMVSGLGRRFLSIPCDLSDIDSIPGIVKKALESFDEIDILANCAGAIYRESVLKYSVEDWDRVVDLNMKSLFFMSQAVANSMVERKIKGKIINIASLMSYQGGIRVAAYAASKGGVRTLTMEMSNELGELGINVNALAPGYVATKMTTALREDPVRADEILGRIPLHRWAKPEDFKGPAVFLASEASDYINGVTIPVDGGWLAR